MMGAIDRGSGECWRPERDTGDTGRLTEFVSSSFELESWLALFWVESDEGILVFSATPFVLPLVLGLLCGDIPGSGSSRIVPNFLRTCLRAGRRIGLLRNISMPESMHSLTLLSSEKAVNATIGAEYPIWRISRVLCNPSRFGIYTR